MARNHTSMNILLKPTISMWQALSLVQTVIQEDRLRNGKERTFLSTPTFHPAAHRFHFGFQSTLLCHCKNGENIDGQCTNPPGRYRSIQLKIFIEQNSCNSSDYSKVTLKTVKVTTHTFQSILTKRVFLKLEILMLCFKRVSAQFRPVYEHDTKVYMAGNKTPFVRTLWQYMELDDFRNGLAALAPRKDLRIQLGRERVTPQRLEIIFR